MKRKSTIDKVIVLPLLLAGIFLLSHCGGGGGGGGAFIPSGGTSKPGAFDLVSPGDGDSSSLTPTFSWTSSSGAKSYTIQVDVVSNPSFSGPLVNQSVTGTYFDLTSDLTDSKEYIWRVIASNSKGSTLATAGTNSFCTFVARSSGGVEWAKVSDPVAGEDAEVFAMAIDSTSMYVAGYDFGAPGPDDEWRIEKRSLLSGMPDGVFGKWQGHAGFVTSNANENEFEDVFAISIDPVRGYMYLAGYETADTGDEKWRIEQRTLSTGQTGTQFGTLGVISENTGTPGSNRAQAITLDADAVYIGGYDARGAGGDPQWRLEKRDLITGNTTTFGGAGIISAPSVTAPSEVWAIAVDGDYVFAAGYYDDGNLQWYLEKRDKLTGELITSFASDLTSFPTPGIITAIAIKGGFIYIAGTQVDVADSGWRLEKRYLTDGSLVAAFGAGGVVTSNPNNEGGDEPKAIAVDDSAVYVAGYDSSNVADDPSHKGQWRIEKYNLDGSPFLLFGEDGVVTNNPSDYEDEIRGICIDSDGIYIAGYDADTPYNDSISAKNFRWRIEKRTK